MKHGSRANGTSAAAHCNYILREQRYDYGAHELIHSESGNLPEWARSATDFWNLADEFEAVNARLYSEFEIALPRELTTQQQIRLVRDFVQEEIGVRHPYTLAIHESDASDGKTNPHVHVMFSTRSLTDGIERPREVFFKKANPKQSVQGGAPKDRQWMAKERLLDLRESWEAHANVALKRAGLSAVIDHRSLEAQGIQRKPETKLTLYESMLWKQGVVTPAVQEVLLLREIATLQNHQHHLEETVSSLETISELMEIQDQAQILLDREHDTLKSLRKEQLIADRTVDKFTEQLHEHCDTSEEACETVRERLYGRAIDEYEELIDDGLVRAKELRAKLEEYGQQPLRLLREAGDFSHSFQQWIIAQKALHEARAGYQRLSQEMYSESVTAECAEKAKMLLTERNSIESERNEALEKALMVRKTIDIHQQVAEDLSVMLENINGDIRTEAQKLSPAYQRLIEPEENQIEIGQETNFGESEAKGQGIFLQHELGFGHK